jgi:hypothetical protein
MVNSGLQALAPTLRRMARRTSHGSSPRSPMAPLPAGELAGVLRPAEVPYSEGFSPGQLDPCGLRFKRPPYKQGEAN